MSKYANDADDIYAKADSDDDWYDGALLAFFFSFLFFFFFLSPFLGTRMAITSTI